MHTERNVILVSIAVVAVLLTALMWKPSRVGTVTGEPLVFYCAAGMQPPVKATAEKYEEEYGIPIQIQYGGSGTLLSSIRVAKQGDLYLAADESYIDIAREQGLLAEALPLAYIRPVIIVQKGNPKNIRSIRDLPREDVTIALGNPDAASIGKTTKRLLEAAGQWQRVERATRVFKPTVGDIVNDVQLGSVDAGVVWDAVAKQFPDLGIVTDPAFDSAEERITIGVLNASQQPTAALRFARYLAARDRGLTRFAEMGFRPVEGDVWEETPEILLFSGGVNRLAIEDTIKQFEEREGAQITRVYNGCGILVAQMKAGERPDAYFACDVSFMTQVEDIFPESVDVAETDMVILVPKGNPRNIQALEDLGKPGLSLGLANAEQSALGALTKRMMDSVGVYEDVQKNVKVQSPTADFLVNQIRLSKLDAVVVYEANCPNVKDEMDIIHIPLPSALAVQPFAAWKDSDHQYLIQRFLDTVRSAESKERFVETGFRWRADEVGG